MTLVEILEHSKNGEYRDEDGEIVIFELKPPMTDSEIDILARQLEVPIPDEIRALMRYAGGFDHNMEVDLTGLADGIDASNFFAKYFSICGDGFGNFWVIDLTGDSWGPVYFVCHDAPILQFQSATLQDFFKECIQMGITPGKSLIDDVHEDRLFEVWTTNPGLVPQSEVLAGSDPFLSEFASQLDEKWWIKDMRNVQPGDGFSWGKFGPMTEVKRFGILPIFAIREPERKPGFFARLFGKA